MAAWLTAVASLGAVALVATGVARAVRDDAAPAREALAAGRLDEADAAVARWLAARPTSAEALYLRAEVRFRLGRFPESDEVLQRAEALGRTGPDVERLRGLLMARSHREGEAEPLLIRAWEGRRGPDPAVAESLARIYLESFRLRPAAKVLDAWASEAPDDPKPCLWRAEADRKLGADASATIRHYREALRRDSGLDLARLGLAERLRTANRAAEAADEFDLYLARHPDDAPAHLGRARASHALGDESAAIAHYDRCLALAPSQTLALTERAAIDLARGRAGEALSLLDRAAALDPFDPEVRYTRSLALGRLGRIVEARGEADASFRLRAEHERFADLGGELVRNPGDVRARAEAARWMVEHGRREEGMVWAEMVLRDQPGHPEMNRLLADFCQKQGKVGLANFYRSRIPAEASAR